MNWVNTAILSAAIMGVVNIFDSHLLSKRMPSLRAFLFPVGLIHLIYASILSILLPLPQCAGTLPVLSAVASGMLRTAAALIMLNSLRREEVSRVIPVVYTYPIFVAIMAAPLLGESLSSLEWLSVVVVVAGAVMVSITGSPSGSIRWRGQLLRLFSASLLFALSDIAGKYALDYITSWNMLWISAFCMSGVFLIFSVRPYIIGQVTNMERRNSAMGLLFCNETLTLVGVVLSFWALQRGTVSLVSTILSSRPLFVLITAVSLSRLAPTFLKWNYGKRILAMRIIATIMIIGGIAIIHLT